MRMASRSNATRHWSGLAAGSLNQAHPEIGQDEVDRDDLVPSATWTIAKLFSVSGGSAHCMNQWHGHYGSCVSATSRGRWTDTSLMTCGINDGKYLSEAKQERKEGSELKCK